MKLVTVCLRSSHYSVVSWGKDALTSISMENCKDVRNTGLHNIWPSDPWEKIALQRRNNSMDSVAGWT